LTVTGYVSATATAVGTSARFTITVGTPTPVTVPVGPVTTGTGTGTFEYTIDMGGAATPTAATMTITTITASDTYTDSGVSQDIFADLGGPETITGLPTGYYYVDVTVVITGGASATIRQVLHIYNSTTSSFVYDFEDGQFVVTRGYTSLITLDVDLQPELENSFTTSAVANASTVTVDINTAGGTPPNPTTTTITVTNASEFASYTWYYNGAAIGTPSSPLVIVAGTAPFEDPLLYHITVVGMHGTVPYDTYFIVEVLDTP